MTKTVVRKGNRVDGQAAKKKGADFEDAQLRMTRTQVRIRRMNLEPEPG